MNFRVATPDDLASLAAARWAFRAESTEERPIESASDFAQRYEALVRCGLESGEWTYWIAETLDGTLVAHMAVRIIESIPRPSRAHDRWGYLTDCYTRPAFRGHDIGRALLEHVANWAKSQDLELLLVWPSDEAQTLYARAGFEPDNEVHVLRLRDFDAPPSAVPT